MTAPVAIVPMAAAKIAQFLQDERPGVVALVGPSGCGKHHTLANAAQQAGVAVAHHDLAQAPVEWHRLGARQLGANGLARGVHVVSSASEQFLKDFAFAKQTLARIVLVADDASASMRGSVPVIRLPAMTSDAMAKRLFLEEDWPADIAVPAARLARGDWHQLHAQRRLFAGAVDATGQSAALAACSMRKDETLANEPPGLIANRLLNGAAPETCPLDASVVSWTERNMAAHCDDIGALAHKQELLAAAAAGMLAGGPASEELFIRAAAYRSKRVHYRPGVYSSPWQEESGDQVATLAESYKRRRASFARSLKEQAMLDERESEGCSVGEKSSGKCRAKAKAKAKAKRRAASKVAE